MPKSIHTVIVPLGTRSYPIYIGQDILKSVGTVFTRHGIGHSIVIITDENVGRRYLSDVRKSLTAKKFTVHAIVLPAGERQKQSDTVDRLYTELLKNNIERSATIVALGGGVIGDLAGYVAATYQRGIGFIQIPTTLLAQVDSSVGGKVGINHPLAKNMIGAFLQPQLVIADTAVLSSLPKREMICGMAEIVKYGLIMDKKFFGFIERYAEKALTYDRNILSTMIRRSCELKASVVSRDEKEEHLRAVLNFGHTIGHSLEHAGKYGRLKHGESVFYGMAAETLIAYEKGKITLLEWDRVEQLIQRFSLPSLKPLRLNKAALIGTMKKDKKTKGGIVRMPLLLQIGKVSLPVPVSKPFLQLAIEYVKVYGS